jgi:TRAP transporter 4TM/12TM fusion protein
LGGVAAYSFRVIDERRHSSMRAFKGVTAWVVSLWAGLATIAHLYTAYIGYLEPLDQRAMHIFWFLPLAFILFPASRTRSPMDRPSVLDWILAAISILPSVYAYMDSTRINLRLENVDPVLPEELVLGVIITLMVIEILRRAVTPILAGMLSLGIVYMFLCEYMPGLFYSRDMPFEEIVETMYLSVGQGVYGAITGISATMVAVFIAYGAFVEKSGIGRLFNNLGTRAAGRYSGGPAKVAVITSAMFGTMSGSSSSNVFTCGSFTIPMMKKLGYRPAFAGGVEAASGVGGQIMPPIMGVGAFIMSEITNTAYSEIILQAALGACCYFTMVFVSVHLEARRLGLVGMKEDEMPAWAVVVRDLYLLIPIFTLIILLMFRYSPHFSAFYSIVATVVVVTVAEVVKLGAAGIADGLLRDRARLLRLATEGLSNLWAIFVTAGKNTASIAIACAGAGMLVAVLNKTGLPPSFGIIITNAAGDQLWLAAILLSITTLMLGMGVPTTPAYVITAAIGAPTLVSQFGVPLIAAHLFVFYFAVLADATPPVSIASYAAASLAKADPILTGLNASRLAIAGYIVGFSYLFAPELRGFGSFFTIMAEVLTIICGLSLTAAGIAGHFRDRIAVPFRVLIIPLGLACGLVHVYPTVWRLAVAATVMAAMFVLPGLFSLGKPGRVRVVRPAVPD